jgi:type 1 glutamine amidotransferase
MKRREMLLATGAAVVGLSVFPVGWVSAADNKKQKILYFTKSDGFVHEMVDRTSKKYADGKLAYSEKLLAELGEKAGFDVVCSQDPAVFDGDLSEFDLIAFYTTGKPISTEQKQKLLDAVSAGKPFVGIHSATDTFHGAGAEIDPYIAMIGGEFVVHNAEQKATNRIASPHFPGVEGLGESIELFEEWYTLKNYAKDLHVILVQETEGMKGNAYERPPFPATWARRHGQGRVFYTSMGHRADVWNNKIFQDILLGGIAWGLGNAQAEIPPNIDQVTPHAEPEVKSQ